MATGGLLAIYAHPDDETFGVGGTMARYAERGVPVTMVCATRGEVGEIAPGTAATPETLGQFREQELRDAMAILGVHDVRFLDYRDSGMRGTPENEDRRNLHNANADDVVAALVRIIRERRPDVIATWDESGGYGHPDHVAVHHHATAAFEAAADAGRYRDAGEPWSTAKLFYTAFPMEQFTQLMEQMHLLGIETPGFADDGEQQQPQDELPRVDPNCILDVSEFYDRKMQAMLAHSTQITAEDPFMRLPEELKRQFFGREYFYQAQPRLPAGVVLSDFMDAA
jgi:N-acetyl-1-D-myo-inositol-2-amino-2-deoxy-alpha-D-glucopyranoside deacetylase